MTVTRADVQEYFKRRKVKGGVVPVVTLRDLYDHGVVVPEGSKALIIDNARRGTYIILYNGKTLNCKDTSLQLDEPVLQVPEETIAQEIEKKAHLL